MNGLSDNRATRNPAVWQPWTQGFAAVSAGRFDVAHRRLTVWSRGAQTQPSVCHDVGKELLGPEPAPFGAVFQPLPSFRREGDRARFHTPKLARFRRATKREDGRYDSPGTDQS